MDLEPTRPAGPPFRVGRDDDAWAIPDWAYAKEDGTFGNRFDDPMGVYRVLYASPQRLGCFIETLARFRVNISFVADLALIEDGEDDFTAFGTVRRAWLKGRCIGRERFPIHQPNSRKVAEDDSDLMEALRVLGLILSDQRRYRTEQSIALENAMKTASDYQVGPRPPGEFAIFCQVPLSAA